MLSIKCLSPRILVTLATIQTESAMRFTGVLEKWDRTQYGSIMKKQNMKQREVSMCLLLITFVVESESYNLFSLE